MLTKALSLPKSHAKGSWQFKTKIHNTAICSNYSMISLDATYLFTNISTNLVLKILKKRGYLIKKHTDYLQLVKFLLNNTFFDNQFYQKIIVAKFS